MVGILKRKVDLFFALVLLCTVAFGQQTALNWGDKGADLFGQGKYDEALQAFDKAIEINPQLAGAWTGKGYTLKALGKYDEAVQAFDKAIEINPQDADAWKDRGKALEAAGRTTEADAAYAKAKELATTSGNATNLQVSSCLNTFSITGVVLEDANGNNNNENALSSWTINLKQQDGKLIQTTQTTKDGKFAFLGVCPGDYELSEIVIAGWTPFVPAEGRFGIRITNVSLQDLEFWNRKST